MNAALTTHVIIFVLTLKALIIASADQVLLPMGSAIVVVSSILGKQINFSFTF